MNNDLAAMIFFLAGIGLLGVPGQADAQQEPEIAPEIGRVIAQEGVDAAKQRFAEMIESDRLNFTLESQGLTALMSGYMQAGNHDAGAAVAEMNGMLMQKMILGQGGGIYPPGMAEVIGELQQAERAAEAQREADLEAERQLQAKVAVQSRGKRRNDLVRFVGLYAEPGSQDLGRSVFVTLSCDGYLVTGPMWADVGPWWMRSAADMVFTYSDAWQSFSMEFEADGSGRIVGMKHEIEGAPSPLENKAPLPERFAACVERPMR